MTVTFLEVLQRNQYEQNCQFQQYMFTSSDVSLQIYASPQCLTSDGLVIVIRMVSNWNIKEYIMNSDKQRTVCISAPFLLCYLTIGISMTVQDHLKMGTRLAYFS